MFTDDPHPPLKGKSNRPNACGKEQILRAGMIIFLPADEYFKDREKDYMDYRGLYIGIATDHGLNLPIQSTKHYWLCDNIDKAKRAIRKINIDAPIEVMNLEQYQLLTSSCEPTLNHTHIKVKRIIEGKEHIPIEIKKVFYLLEQGERINVIVEVSQYGYSIAFHDHAITGFTHVTDETLNIRYYERADEAIQHLEPLKAFINCHISLRFANVAKISTYRTALKLAESNTV